MIFNFLIIVSIEISKYYSKFWEFIRSAKNFFLPNYRQYHPKSGWNNFRKLYLFCPPWCFFITLLLLLITFFGAAGGSLPYSIQTAQKQVWLHSYFQWVLHLSHVCPSSEVLWHQRFILHLVMPGASLKSHPHPYLPFEGHFKRSFPFAANLPH